MADFERIERLQQQTPANDRRWEDISGQDWGSGPPIQPQKPNRIPTDSPPDPRRQPPVGSYPDRYGREPNPYSDPYRDSDPYGQERVPDRRPPVWQEPPRQWIPDQPNRPRPPQEQPRQLPGIPDWGYPSQPNPVWPMPVPDTLTAPTEKVAPPGSLIAPTLREPPNPNDRTIYPLDDPMTKMFAQTKDAVAKIAVEAKINGETKYGAGSGFFIEKEGKLATAFHVVQYADKINVTTTSGKVYQAKIVDVQPTTDIAILQVQRNDPSETFPTLKIADSTRGLSKDDDYYVVGHPAGWDPVFISKGKLKDHHVQSDIALPSYGHDPDRMLLSFDLMSLRGNSGSPLLNSKGEVVGITNFGNDHGDTYSSVAEDLSKIVNKDHSWTMPQEFYWGERPRQSLAIGTAAAALGLASRIVPASVTPYARFPLAMYSGYVGGMELFEKDLPFLQSAFNGGSSQQKFNSVLNSSADTAMLLGGAAMMIAPKRMGGIGLVIAGTGAAVKFVSTAFPRRGIY